jgi:hypothetical protein
MVQLSMKMIKNVFLLASISFLLASCSSAPNSVEDQSSSSELNPLAELTNATSSSDAYNRACYWLKEGDNILGFQRIQEGNTLATSEGKLPLLGVEQAMETVLNQGEPQAIDEYQVVKDFCSNLGFLI